MSDTAPDRFAGGRALGAWAHLPAQPLEGQPGGPLAGLSFSVKDLLEVSGWPTRASTPAPLPALEPSPLVPALLKAGARCVGKTHLHEIALGILGWNPLSGQAGNPLDPQRISGGSSSGAAISVALGECDFALGTDTGGSIRIPAALCGIAGFKPSHGRYPSVGCLPLSPTCDHVGTLARGVGTLIRVDHALSAEASPAVRLEGLRVGYWNVPDWTTPPVWAQFMAVAGALEARPFSFPDVLETYSLIVQSEAAWVHRAALEHEQPPFGAPTLELLRRGQGLPAWRFVEAQAQRRRWLTQLEERFKEFDVLLAPTVPAAAPKMGQDLLELTGGPEPLRPAFLRLTAPLSLLGVPTVSLPLRHASPADGTLSVGVQLIGPSGSDARLLALALELEHTIEALND